MNAPIEGRCGARLRGERAGKFCTSYPVHGKRRCRIHGGAPQGPHNGAPKGPRNGNWKHGARATVVVPLNETEEQILRSYEVMSRGDTAAKARGITALRHHRASVYALGSNDHRPANETTHALAHLLDVEHRMEKGYVVNHVIDERVIGSLVRLFFAVLEANIVDKALLASIVEEMGRVDWSKAAEIPALEATVAAAGEHR